MRLLVPVELVIDDLDDSSGRSMPAYVVERSSTSSSASLSGRRFVSLLRFLDVGCDPVGSHSLVAAGARPNAEADEANESWLPVHRPCGSPAGRVLASVLALATVLPLLVLLDVVIVPL